MTTNLKRRLASGESGFTLIELLVVMIIISILMAVAIPSFLNQKQRAVASNLKTAMKGVTETIEACGQGLSSGEYFDTNGAAGSRSCANSTTVKGAEPGLPVGTSDDTTITVPYVNNLNTAGMSIGNNEVAAGVLCTSGTVAAPVECSGYYVIGKMTKGTDAVAFVEAKNPVSGKLVRSCGGIASNATNGMPTVAASGSAGNTTTSTASGSSTASTTTTADSVVWRVTNVPNDLSRKICPTGNW